MNEQWDKQVAADQERAERAEQERAERARVAHVRERLRTLYAATFSGLVAARPLQPGMAGWGAAQGLAREALVLAQAALVVEETEHAETETWIRQVIVGLPERLGDPAPWPLECEHCGERIADLDSAMLFWGVAPSGRPSDPMVAHKGRCDPRQHGDSLELRDALSMRLSLLRDYGWSELQRARLLQIFGAIEKAIAP